MNSVVGCLSHSLRGVDRGQVDKDAETTLPERSLGSGEEEPSLYERVQSSARLNKRTYESYRDEQKQSIKRARDLLSNMGLEDSCAMPEEELVEKMRLASLAGIVASGKQVVNLNAQQKEKARLWVEKFDSLYTQHQTRMGRGEGTSTGSTNFWQEGVPLPAPLGAVERGVELSAETIANFLNLIIQKISITQNQAGRALTEKAKQTSQKNVAKSLDGFIRHSEALAEMKSAAASSLLFSGITSFLGVAVSLLSANPLAIALATVALVQSAVQISAYFMTEDPVEASSYSLAHGLAWLADKAWVATGHEAMSDKSKKDLESGIQVAWTVLSIAALLWGFCQPAEIGNGLLGLGTALSILPQLSHLAASVGSTYLNLVVNRAILKSLGAQRDLQESKKQIIESSTDTQIAADWVRSWVDHQAVWTRAVANMLTTWLTTSAKLVRH